MSIHSEIDIMVSEALEVGMQTVREHLADKGLTLHGNITFNVQVDAVETTEPDEPEALPRIHCIACDATTDKAHLDGWSDPLSAGYGHGRYCPTCVQKACVREQDKKQGKTSISRHTAMCNCAQCSLTRENRRRHFLALYNGPVAVVSAPSALSPLEMEQLIRASERGAMVGVEFIGIEQDGADAVLVFKLIGQRDPRIRVEAKRPTVARIQITEGLHSGHAMRVAQQAAESIQYCVMEVLAARTPQQ